MKRILAIATLAAVTWTAPSGAVVFDALEAPRTFSITDDFTISDLFLFDALGVPLNRSVTGGLSGTITLGKRPGPGDPRRPEGNVPRDGIAPITFEDLLDFDLTLNLPLDIAGSTVSIPVAPGLGGIDLIDGSYSTDGTNLFVDATNVLTGNPFLQVTRDRFPQELAFPNGQRFGDDGTDQLLIQLLSGSVNLLTASLPDGFASPPGVIGFGQVSDADRLVLATAQADGNLSAVPLPAGLLLSLSALAGLAALRRRR